MLGDSTLSVAISNPPPRNAPTVERQSTFVPSLGGGKKDNRFGEYLYSNSLRFRLALSYSLLKTFLLPGPGLGALLSSYLEGVLYKFHG